MFANNDLKISFCDNDASKIEKQQLLDCNEFLVNSDEWEVKSLTIGFVTAAHDYVEVKVEGHKIADNLTANLKQYSPAYIYIENIVLINDKGE